MTWAASTVQQCDAQAEVALVETRRVYEERLKANMDKCDARVNELVATGEAQHVKALAELTQRHQVLHEELVTAQAAKDGERIATVEGQLNEADAERLKNEQSRNAFLNECERLRGEFRDEALAREDKLRAESRERESALRAQSSQNMAGAAHEWETRFERMERLHASELESIKAEAAADRALILQQYQHSVSQQEQSLQSMKVEYKREVSAREGHFNEQVNRATEMMREAQTIAAAQAQEAEDARIAGAAVASELATVQRKLFHSTIDNNGSARAPGNGDVHDATLTQPSPANPTKRNSRASSKGSGGSKRGQAASHVMSSAAAPTRGASTDQTTNPIWGHLKPTNTALLAKKATPLGNRAKDGSLRSSSVPGSRTLEEAEGARRRARSQSSTSPALVASGSGGRRPSPGPLSNRNVASPIVHKAASRAASLPASGGVSGHGHLGLSGNFGAGGTGGPGGNGPGAGGSAPGWSGRSGQPRGRTSQRLASGGDPPDDDEDRDDYEFGR